MQGVQQKVTELLNEASPQGGAGGALKNFFGNSKRVRWPASASVPADMTCYFRRYSCCMRGLLGWLRLGWLKLITSNYLKRSFTLP